MLKFNSSKIKRNSSIVNLEKFQNEFMKKHPELNNKIQEYESKFQQMKEEYIKKEEIYKIKLSNQERLSQSTNRANDEEISELRKENTTIKNNFDLLKKQNEQFNK